MLQEDVTKFRSSRRAKAAIELLSGSGRVTKRSAANARNYLITELILTNAARPSDFVGLTQELVAGGRDANRRLVNGQQYVELCTTSSKPTSATGLPSYLMLTEEVDARLKQYQERARPVLASASSPDDVFLLQNGKAMEDANYSSAYRTIWRAAGLDDPDFKTGANSRHVRHTANGMANVMGSVELQKSVHIGLNHGLAANQKNYMSIVRPHLSVSTKAEMLRLREERSAEFDQLVRGEPVRRTGTMWTKRKEPAGKTTAHKKPPVVTTKRLTRLAAKRQDVTV